MHPIKSLSMSLLVLLGLSALHAQSNGVEQFSLADFSAEQAGRWHSRVRMLADADQGPVACWTVPANTKVDGVTLTLGDWAPECDEWEELRFLYRLDRVPQWFGVKVTDYPLADGMQATWQLEVPSDAAGQWRQAVVRLHAPRWHWGEAPNKERRAIDFRVQNDVDAALEVRVARLQLLRRKVQMAGAPTLSWAPGGSSGHLEFTVINRSQEQQLVRPRLQSSNEGLVFASLPELALAAGQQQDYRVSISCPKPLAPLTPFQVEIFLPTPGMLPVAGDDLLSARTALQFTAPLEGIPVPSLLFTSEQLAALRERIASEGPAQKWWDGLLRKADDWLARTPQYPPRGAQWWHWYSCKNCGVNLKTASPTRHVCPQCQEEYSGWPYDDVVLSRDHDALAHSVRDLGIAYQLSGERRYAAKAQEILHGYAERYLEYPLHDIHGEPKRGGGHVHPQTLDEAIWLISIAQGFDAIQETLSAADIEFLAEKMLRPAAEMIKDHQWGIHNICCWHASAYGLVGIALGDQQLLGAAINGPKGFHAQVEKGVTTDGPWYEGAWGYHFYTMAALEPLAIAAKNLGIDVHSQRYKGMYDAPLKFLTPSYQLPAFNDSGRVSFTPSGMGWRYETAYAWWGDPLHAWMAAGGHRQSMNAALWGRKELQLAHLDFSSGAYDAAGAVVLRSQSPQVPPGDIPCNYVAVDYGEHGGGHGHPDKLNIVIWGRGELLAEDPGCIAYGNPAHQGWYRQSLSHNTLVVDGKSQRPACGELLAFASANDATLCSVTAGDIYTGVEAGRVLALVDDLILDMLWAHSQQEHQYEWCFHSRGALTLAQAGEPAATPAGDGYQWVPHWQRRAHDGAWQAEWRHKEVLLRLWQRSAAGELWDGVGMGNPATVKPPLVINRQQGRNAFFASLMAISGQDEKPAPGAILDQGMDEKGNCWLKARYDDKLYVLLASPAAEMRYADFLLQGQAALLISDEINSPAPNWQKVLVK
jgi:hypothetical protein